MSDAWLLHLWLRVESLARGNKVAGNKFCRRKKLGIQARLLEVVSVQVVYT